MATIMNYKWVDWFGSSKCKCKGKKKKKNNASRLLMEALVPAGDYFFIEVGGTIIIKSDTKDNLILAVVAHRINNGLPLGKPAEEIEAQIKGRGNNGYVPRKN